MKKMNELMIKLLFYNVNHLYLGSYHELPIPKNTKPKALFFFVML